MQRLEVSCAARRIYTSLGAKGLIISGWRKVLDERHRKKNQNANFMANTLFGKPLPNHIKNTAEPDSRKKCDTKNFRIAFPRN